jgi:hypothetical protein
MNICFEYGDSAGALQGMLMTEREGRKAGGDAGRE